MKTAFSFWIESEEGRTCLSAMNCIRMPYRENILWRSFHAGLQQSGINKENEELRKQISELRIECYSAKELVRKLTKYKKQKS